MVNVCNGGDKGI